MNKEYLVRRVNKEVESINHQVAFQSIDWSKAEEGFIHTRNWSDFPYPVDSRFYLLYNDYNFYLLMLTKGEHELSPLAEVREAQGPVHNDSCLEFFFSYEKDSLAYVNIETNALATKYLAFGESRKDRYKANAEELEEFRIEPVAKADKALLSLAFDYDWGVFVHLPLRFLARFWPNIFAQESDLIALESGQVLKGNFYKCGDLTEVEHYLSWAPIETEAPDFHRPEFFADLVLE